MLAISCHAYAISSINVQIGEMEGAAGQARNVTLDYRLDHELKLKGQIKTPSDKQWTDAGFSCASIASPETGHWRCDDGTFTADKITVPFSLALNMQKPNGMQQIGVELTLKQATFSDAAGLHAGEKVTGKISINATQAKDQWLWQTAVDWAGGELFWQPFYFASGGHQLQASGSLDPQFLTVENGSLSLKDVGQMQFSGQWQLADKKIRQFTASAPNLNLATLYPLILKPLLEKTSLNNLDVSGKTSLKLGMDAGNIQSFQVDLDNADIDDKNGRFALYKLSTSIVWEYDAAKTVTLGYQSGHLLRVPLGAANLTAELNRYALTASELKLPMLDGALILSDLSAAWVADQWHWHVRANLAPISMPELTHALALPRMEGKVSSTIPLVTYSGGNLTTDGALLFNVFDGTVSVTDLAMQDPLGAASRLSANLQMRNLDLGELTRTFSFGAIEGKLDGDVKNLLLVNWQASQFDAVFQSSPGRYPKKISQRAVENISALGGAGAAAAIQRSFLRFFKEFNYDKIGLSCRLRNDICQMEGIESTAQGYIIVKGSGVPSITVMGYNHSVSWGDFLARVKRITDGNAKPIVN